MPINKGSKGRVKEMKKFKKWLLQRKDWIEPACALISLFVVGLFGICLTIMQVKITNNSNTIMERQVLPHFRTCEMNYDHKSDGTYDGRVLRVTNHGGNFYAFHSEVFSFALFESTVDKNCYIFPLINLYRFTNLFQLSQINSSGETVVEHFTFDDISVSTTLSDANRLLEEDWSNRVGSFTGILTFAKITYQDCFGNKKVIYQDVYDSTLIDENIGELVFSFNRTFHDIEKNLVSFDIDDVDTELLCRFAETTLKDQFRLNRKVAKTITR